jgi:hypothetical protein
MSTRHLSPIVNKLCYLTVFVQFLRTGKRRSSPAVISRVLLPFGDIWTDRKVFARVVKNNDNNIITGHRINDSTLGRAWYAERTLENQGAGKIDPIGRLPIRVIAHARQRWISCGKALTMITASCSCTAPKKPGNRLSSNSFSATCRQLLPSPPSTV